MGVKSSGVVSGIWLKKIDNLYVHQEKLDKEISSLKSFVKDKFRILKLELDKILQQKFEFFIDDRSKFHYVGYDDDNDE